MIEMGAFGELSPWSGEAISGAGRKKYCRHVESYCAQENKKRFLEHRESSLKELSQHGLVISGKFFQYDHLNFFVNNKGDANVVLGS